MDVGMQLRWSVGGRLLAVVAILSLSVGCDDDDDDPGRDGGDGGEVLVDSGRVDGDGSVGALTEAQVAGVVNAMNEAEIAFARSVQDRLADDDIAALAADTISGHTASATEHAEVIETLGITPAESPLSTSIERQAASMAEDLASFTGAELDQAYLDGQIILDAELLDDIQAIVIPSTSNTRYRTYLFELRDLLFSNLQAGRELDEPATGGTVVAP